MKSDATAKSTAGGYVSTPTQSAIVFSPPRHARQDEQHEPGQQPEQRVALAQPPAPDQLEDDEQQEDRRDRGGDRDVAAGSCSSSRGTTLRRNEPTKSASSTLTM